MSTGPRAARLYVLGLLGLTVGLAALRLAYLAWLCPYGLVEDESQYWEWSRHLSLSYYTKGPGIAWTIACFTQVLGHTELAVRAAAPVFSAIMLGAIGLLVRWGGAESESPARAWRAALYAAGALAAAPIVFASALLGTIDGPYCAMWALACLCAWHLLKTRSPGARAGLSLALGAALGVGFLFKYTILLLPPGLALFAWLRPAQDRHSPQLAGSPGVGPRDVALIVLAFVVCAAPVFIWNHQQGWPTLRHLLGHLGFEEPALRAMAAPAPATVRAWSPLWLPVFLASQFGLAGPGLVLGLIGAVRAWRGRADPARRIEWFLLCAAAPIFLFYLAVSLVAEPEGNWPMGGLVTLLPLGGLVAADAMRDYHRRLAEWLAKPQPRPREGFIRRRPETAGQVLWHLTLGVGIIGGVLMTRVDLLARLPGLDRVVPRERLTQGPVLAAGVESIRARAADALAQPPLLIVQHYGRASQLAFYLPDRPIVYCASSRLGGRPTQHDFWPTHDLADPALRGRGAVLIGATAEAWGAWFESVEDLGLVPGVERKGVRAFLGRGYRGPPDP